jgi:hypothetical protein
MAPTAYAELPARLTDVDQLVAAHKAVGGDERRRRFELEGINRAAALMLSTAAVGPRTQVTPCYLVPTWSLAGMCRYQESQNRPITRLFV